MKKRITAFLMCILIMVSIVPPYAHAVNDYASDVGKYAQLNSYYADDAVFVHDGSKNFAMTDVLVYDYVDFEAGLIVRITDWYLDSVNSALWYQVEPYQGNLPADMPAGYWIFQRYTDDDSEVDTLLFVTVDPPKAETTVKVDGIEASEYTMDKYEKPLLEASSTLIGTVSYRWQILADKETDLWVDIYGQEESALSLSYAMVKSLLNSENQAWVRCISSANDQEAIGEAFCVTVYDSAETQLMEETESTEETETEEEIESAEEAELVEETESAEETETEEETESAEETETEEETEPTEETETEEEIESTEEAEPVEETEPTEETETEEEIESTEEAEPVAETESAEEAEPVEETESTEEAEPVEETESAEETETEEETESTEETESEEETESTGETEPIEEIEAVKMTLSAKASADKNPEDTEGGIMLAAEGDELPEEPTEDEVKTYILSILYVYGSESIHAGTAVAPAWSAEISPLQEYEAVIESPEFPGYTPDQASVIFNYPVGTLTSDVQIVVNYNPAEVTYTVLHRWQNIYDDQYSDYEIVTKSGKTESLVPGNLSQKDNGDPLYDGLEPLPYATEAIAADGTTMVEIRHDRIYYLMTFELNGGYGTYPIYARYETALTIPNPTRPGYEFLGWDKLDANGVGDGILDTLPSKMPMQNAAYKAVWETLDTNYSVVYWIENTDGTRTYMETKVESAKSDDTVSGIDDFAAANFCEMELHTHTRDCYNCRNAEHAHNASCYTCGLDSHLTQIDQGELTCGHVHNTSCCTGYNRQNPSGNDLTAFSAIGNDEPESGYVYTINASGDGNTYYYLYVDGVWYRQVNNNSWVSGASLGTGQVYLSGKTFTANKYNVRLNCGHVHSGNCTHNASCYKCKLENHSHTQDCKSELSKYVEFVRADQNVTVQGDGSTIVNVYYKKKLFEIRYVFARRSGQTYQIASLTRDGVLGNWELQSADGQPTVKSDSGFTVKEERIGDFTYYYIAVRAEYGANIEALWPGNAINDIRVGNTNYRFGSWAAENGTPYRANDPEHANIVGPYPYMSAEMIKTGNENIAYTDADGTTYYVAQRMSAWWGTVSNAGISEHVYHIYYESLDGTGVRQYNGKWYKLVDKHVFNCAHNGSTRVDPFYYNGFKCINDTRGENNSNLNSATDYQKDSKNYAKGQTHYDCPNNSCAHCNCFYYDRVEHTLIYVNDNVFSKAPDPQIMKYGASLTNPGTPDYPVGMEPGAYEFDGWYTTAECLDGTDVKWNTITMPDNNLTLYAKWKPVMHEVHIYRYRNADGSFPTNADDILLEDLGVSHGTLIPEQHIPEKPSDTEQQTFDGWFYIDKNGQEQAFDFYNIPVNQDLNIYAKWKSNQLRDVIVRYVTEVDGVDVEIAPPETFKGYVGDAKTYEAKTENQLYEDYRTNYYPTTASSSITVSEDENMNELIFRYVYRESPPYTVEYWIEDADGTLRPAFRETADGGHEFVGNTVITEAEMYKNYVTDHGMSVVTVRALPATKYLPDQIQKRLIISADESKNVIKFIYTYAPSAAIYVVNHYLVKPGVTVVNGPEDYDLQSYEEITGEVDSTVSANPIAVFGAEFSETITVTQNPATEGYTWEGTTKTLSAKVKEGNSTILDFFYTRIECEYRVLYIDRDTGAELGRKTGLKAQYGQTVEEDAKAYDGYMVDEDTKSITIQAGTAAANTITFYYTRKTADIQISKKVDLDEQQKEENPDLALPEGEENRKFEFTILAKDKFHKNQFQYTITRKNGTVETGTVSVKDSLFKELGPITLCDGDKIVVHGLSLGDYTVKETHVIGYKTTIGAVETETKNVTLDTHGDDVTVDFLNTYPFFTGDLILSKTIDKADPSDPDGIGEIFTYTITVKPADGTLEETRIIKFKDLDGEGKVIDNTCTIPAGGYGKEYEFTLRLKAGDTVTVEDIPEGEIRVWESIDESHYVTPYYTVSYTKKNPAQDTTPGNSSVVRSQIYGGHNTTVAYTNTYRKDSLTIQKTVEKEYPLDTLDQDTFTFVVTGETKLPDGTYEILIGTTAGTATVEDGNVTISADPQITVIGEGSASLLIDKLPAGNYTVQETDAGKGLEAYNQNPSTGEVTDLQLIGTGKKKAAFTNTFKRGKGNLYLEKELVAATGFNPDELPVDIVFSFTVTLTEDVLDGVKVQVAYNGGVAGEVTLNNGSLTVQIEADEYVTITGLPVGKYRITETTIPSYANQFALKENGSWAEQPSTSTADGAMYLDINVATEKTTEVKCTNIYPIDRAELVIQKLVTKEYERDTLPDDDFIFTVKLAEIDLPQYSYTVYNQDGTEYARSIASVDADNAFSITLSPGQYAVVPDMPVCGYIVTESADSEHYNMSYQVYQTEAGDTASEVVDTSGELVASGDTRSMERTFVAGKIDTVVFTNEYKRHLTNLTIDRNVAADPEQVFVYEVVNNTSWDVITVTVVGNGETTIYDLPYGEYTITQRNDWSWRYRDESQQETLSADNNNEGQAAKVEFNGYASAKWLDGFSQLICNIYTGGGIG